MILVTCSKKISQMTHGLTRGLPSSFSNGFAGRKAIQHLHEALPDRFEGPAMPWHGMAC